MKKIVLAVTLVASATTLALVLAQTGTSSPPPWPFSTVTASELATSGVTVTDAPALPDAASATAKANSAASAAFGGAAVRESHYLNCQDSTAVPQINQNCFVVSVDPAPLGTAGIADWLGGKQHSFKWAVVLIDPATDAVIEEKASTQ
jgi:hypothetical protein